MYLSGFGRCCGWWMAVEMAEADSAMVWRLFLFLV